MSSKEPTKVARTRSVGTETRGDDPKTSGGRRQISQQAAVAQAERCDRSKRIEQTEGAATSREKKTKDQCGGKSEWKSLEEKKRHRSKRCGYDHPAAKASEYDLFAMPDGGVSNCLAARSKQRVDPFLHKPDAAGLDSGKCAGANKIYAESKEPQKHGYFPVGRRNPINHKVLDAEDEHTHDALKMGAAGVTTARLTTLNQPGVTIGENDTGVVEIDRFQAGNGDFIAHKGEPPPMETGGKRRFNGPNECHKDSVNVKHYPGNPTRMSEKEVKKWATRKQVQIRGGEFRYNVAGHEDMLPPATNMYSKADRPPSRWHRAENDKRYLPGFYRVHSTDQRNKHECSEDFDYIMGRMKDPPMQVPPRQRVLSLSSDASDCLPGKTVFGEPAEVKAARRRAQSARALPSDGGRRTPPRRYTPSDTGRSMTPPPRFSPPQRSQGSGSVYSADIPNYGNTGGSRPQFYDPNLVTMSSTPMGYDDDDRYPPMF